MSDCEDRIEGGRFFLDCARKTDLNEPQYKWHIQATASFAVAAIQILYYDYGVDKELFSRESRHDLEELKRRYPNHQFFWWLWRKLELDIPKDERSLNARRYDFLREERNSILHRGERDKRKIEIRQPVGSGPSSVTIVYYFIGWDSEPCEEACENTITFAEGIIREAKNSGYF